MHLARSIYSFTALSRRRNHTSEDVRDLQRALDAGNKSTIRVVFIGDSLIRRSQVYFKMLDQITAILEANHPSVRFELINKGIDGDRISWINDRLEADTISLNPEIAVVLWDSDVSDIDETLLSSVERYLLHKTYRWNLQTVIGRLQSAGIDVMVSGPVLLGERPKGQNRDDKKLEYYCRINREVAGEMGVEYIDLRAAFVRALPQPSALCGLPYLAIDHDVKRAFMDRLSTSFGYSLCWSALWIAEAFSSFISTRRSFFGLGAKDGGALTVDGEHFNERGVGIAVTLFSTVLEQWFTHRRPPLYTLVVDQWEDIRGNPVSYTHLTLPTIYSV